MITNPNIDPVLLSLGPLQVHWYGVTYLLGFVAFYLFGKVRVKRYPKAIAGKVWSPEDISDLLFYGFLGVILGGRLGYVLFYKPAEYLAEPLEIIMINHGGMSFHGGFLGVVVALLYYARKSQRRLLDIGDFVAPLAPLGIFFVRIGNFINQELWGKPTDLPWGMVFIDAGNVPRHPSMLYEAFLEGLVLFLVLWWVGRKATPAGRLSGLFLIGYAISRMLVELVRVPDAHLNYLIADWVTMGHILSLPMLIVGIILVARKP